MTDFQRYLKEEELQL